MYFSCEKQNTEGEDCRQLDDGKQQLIGFHHTLCLLMGSTVSSALPTLLFHDGH